MPQMRDVQLLFTDGQTFFHQETQYLERRIQRMPSCLGYRVEGGGTRKAATLTSRRSSQTPTCLASSSA
jgi:hypothetical protein